MNMLHTMLPPRLSALLRPLLLLLLALPAAVRAVFPDEIGHIDYHHELVGLPQPGTTFFHRPRRDDKASLLYTLSDVGVLAAVNPASGAILWRHLLDDTTTTTTTTTSPSTGNRIASRNAPAASFLRVGEGEGWLVGALRSSVHAWDAVTGRSRWWMDFAGEVRDLEIMEMTEKSERKDVLALAEEGAEAGAAPTTVLRRLDGDDGSVVWEFRETTKDVPLQVSTDVEKVFVISLHGTTAPYSLKVTTVDTRTGRRLGELTVGTKGGDVQSADHVMFVGANSAAPILAWTDQERSNLYINVLGTKTRQEFPLEAGTVAVEIHAPHLVQSQPHFLVHSRTKAGNRAEVYHINLKNNAITKAYDLPQLAGPGAFSVSSNDANVYFTRITEDEIILHSSASHAVLGRWPLEKQADTESAESTESKMIPLHAVTEVVKRSALTDSYALRSAIVTDADEWVMIREGKVAWDRPEGMTGVVAASFAEIPGSGDLAKELEQEAHSNPWEAYVHRWKRHINDLQYLPEYLDSIPSRLINSITGSESASASASKAGRPLRDSFGFNKLVILATRRGRLYGLDTGNHGQVLWSQKAFNVPRGKRWNVKGMHVQDSKGQVTIRGADGEHVVVQTDTGKVLESMPPKSWPPVESTALVDSPQGQWLMTIGPGGKIGSIPSAWTPKQNLVVRTPEGGLRGVGFVDDGSQSHEVTLWTFSLPAGQRIASIATRPSHDVVASIGRVLGDRRVLYKYLNPNTLVVAAADDAASTLTVYLLDTVSGEVLHSAVHTGVDTRDPAHKPTGCVMAENWFLCAFFGDHVGLRADPAQSLKGFQLVVTDLYESAEPNDRGPLGDPTTTTTTTTPANMSSLAPVDNPAASITSLLPHAVSQAYILSAPVSALQVSQTRQGVATRMVLAYLPTLHGVAGLPCALLEPRRPVGRDATPAEAEAEGLIRYAPAIELDPKMVVSHRRDVLGVRALAAAPAVVESTGLVLAWGDVDVFGTRVAPSFAFDILGKGFNKVMLIGTVLALGVGVVVVGPLVRRKQINMRWTAPL